VAVVPADALLASFQSNEKALLGKFTVVPVGYVIVAIETDPSPGATQLWLGVLLNGPRTGSTLLSGNNTVFVFLQPVAVITTSTV
jgi:hypothetical protein